MRIAVLLLAVVLTWTLAACGQDPGDGAGDGAGDGETPAASCPDTDHPGGQQRFVVGFEPGSDLADDEQARRELWADLGARLCATFTEVDPPLRDGAVLRADRPLGTQEQRDLLARLRRDPDVRYAQPDGLATPDATPDATLDGGSTR